MARNKTETQPEAETEAQQVDPIFEAFVAAVNQGSDEDGVKLAMISAGATFKNVTRLYNQYLIDAGLAVSKEEKETVVAELLTGQDLSNEEVFDSVCVSLIERLAGMTEKSAASTVRAWCRKNEVECYSKPKSSGEGRDGFAKGYRAFLVANPNCTAEEATAFIMGTDGHAETSENVKRHRSSYLNLQKLANSIAAKYQ